MNFIQFFSLAGIVLFMSKMFKKFLYFYYWMGHNYILGGYTITGAHQAKYLYNVDNYPMVCDLAALKKNMKFVVNERYYCELVNGKYLIVNDGGEKRLYEEFDTVELHTIVNYS